MSVILQMATARITHREASEAIGITPATLYRYCRAKRIAFYRIGNRNFYAVAEVERFIRACENLRDDSNEAA